MSKDHCSGVCINYETANDKWECKWIGLGHQCTFVSKEVNGMEEKINKIEKIVPIKALTSKSDLCAKINEMIDVVNVLIDKNDDVNKLRTGLYNLIKTYMKEI
jgi:hypothetical protein